jgi:hypothetical protein
MPWLLDTSNSFDAAMADIRVGHDRPSGVGVVAVEDGLGGRRGRRGVPSA